MGQVVQFEKFKKPPQPEAKAGDARMGRIVRPPKQYRVFGDGTVIKITPGVFEDLLRVQFLIDGARMEIDFGETKLTFLD